jgi:hypothetical protein
MRLYFGIGQARKQQDIEKELSMQHRHTQAKPLSIRVCKICIGVPSRKRRQGQSWRGSSLSSSTPISFFFAYSVPEKISSQSRARMRDHQKRSPHWAMLSVTLSLNRKSIDFIPSYPHSFAGEAFKKENRYSAVKDRRLGQKWLDGILVWKLDSLVVPRLSI